MTAEIKTLKVHTASPRQDLIEQLEILLAKAKAGEVQGVVAVTDAVAGWTGTMRMGTTTYAMVGRMNEMIRNMLAQLDD